MKMKRILLVVNPCAGMKKSQRYLADIISELNRGGYEVCVHITQGRGDATDVVRSRAQDMDVVACCGGDGTFNEMVSGLLESGVQIPVGYIPAGSTNDFANSLKLPSNPVEAARQIVEGTPSPYDMGRFGERYFSYVASFGAFTKASYATPQSVKNAIGHMAYLLEGIQELSQIRNEHLMLETGEELIEDDFLFGAICNSTSLGGVLTLDPKMVDMSDGKFELLLVRAPRELGEVKECLQALKKQQYDCGMITFRSASSVKVWANPVMPWTLDGEAEDGHKQVDVVNLHHAIRLLK